jgi:hypothetical protein
MSNIERVTDTHFDDIDTALDYAHYHYVAEAEKYADEQVAMVIAEKNEEIENLRDVLDSIRQEAKDAL